MSIAKRLISGSIASWVQIAITIIAQVALLPIYLSSWDIKTFGLWIAVQGLSGMMTSLDTGHHTYLSFEFIRLGRDKLKLTSFYLWSGVWVGLIMGFLPIVIIIIGLLSGTYKYFLTDKVGGNTDLVFQAGIVLLLQAATWFICSSVGGLFLRVLSAFDYYARIAWWNAGIAAFTTILPAVAVFFGAGLLTTGIIQAIIAVIGFGMLNIDVFYLLRKEKISFSKGSLKFGWKNFTNSLVLSVKNLLENVRNVGFRAILAVLTSAANLVTFSSIRTGANFAMQGLHTITYPLMPDLIRFLHQRDQQRSETAFGTIWIIVVAIMAPALIVLQIFIEPLFHLWTRGKVPFDPILFAVLSLSVMVYAISQPAIAVITGNNLLKIQFNISALAAFVVVAGSVLTVPAAGILGAGVVLLLSEIASAIWYNQTAKVWLANNGLLWPKMAWRSALLSVVITAAGMAAIIMVPSFKYISLIATLVLMFINAFKYWQFLPPLARQRTTEILKKSPFVKYFITVSSPVS
ncbi:lipopolysaccharide biosynthesis protein [Mucilaginibacter lacusdianchii]|uniref:lipopolysaccharide biosynthesis protein n=1 Tax=Mucilaginibacter lacusdianchii TaxID=2684211 RepID=UPI00131E5A67|nr:hypothetical protein [Mucilaginibacter sp. JXJ CY 39]